jgi:hypothetical protein
VKQLARYRTPLVLAALCAGFAGFIAWDRTRATTDELQARQRMVFRAFHRERVDRIVVQHRSGRFELLKRGREQWSLVAGRGARGADAVEVERLLSEIEGAEAQRTLGVLDGASRTRFGLDAPRAEVTVHEGPEVTARLVLGGAVEREAAVYALIGAREGARDRATQAVVLPRSVADVLDRPATDFRDRLVADVDVLRVDGITLDRAEGGRIVLTRQGPSWRLDTPALGRAARGAVEAVTTDLRELRATRVVADDASDDDLRRYGLDRPTVRAEFRRGNGVEPVRIAVGGRCPGDESAWAATREGTRTVVCLATTFVDPMRAAAEGFRDDRVLGARTDEIARVRITPGLADGQPLVIVREGSGWRAEGTTTPVDTEALEAWFGALHDLTSTRRLDGDVRVARGLLPGATAEIEVTRAGIEGVERIRVGREDAEGVPVSRDDEPIVLLFPPSVADTLRVDAARFRPRDLVHDEPTDLQGLVLEVGAMREEMTRSDGQLRLVHPVQGLADPAATTELVRQLADLSADRWVSSRVRPEHGFTTPRARVTARFEGNGPAGSDGGARVRNYTLVFGAPAPTGGYFARLDGREGVFVLPRALVDMVSQPHVDRGALRVDTEALTRIALTLRSPARRVVVVRDGNGWRTEAGATVARERIDALLDRLGSVGAPRAFGYGAAPAEAHFDAPTAVLELTLGGGDAAAQTVRITLGDRFGAGEGAGWYARREGLDATLSVPDDYTEALQRFEP